MTREADMGDLIATFQISGHGNHQMRGPVTIGRDPRADEGTTVEVHGDPLVSKSHLCIDIDEGDLIITDLGSSNGTFLHHIAGETAVPSDRWIPIPAGAEIEFGDQRMTIERVAPVAARDLESHTDADDAVTVEHAAPAVPPVLPSTPNVAPAPDEAPPAAGLITCVHCHRELPPGSKFCDGCGMPVMPSSVPEPIVDDADRTVVVSPGGFVPAGQPPAPQPSVAPGPPPPQYGGPAPQYGGPPTHPSPQVPQPGQYGQPPPGAPGSGAIAQPSGGLVFIDPSSFPKKSGVRKRILVGILALVLLGLLALVLVAVLGGEDESSVSSRGDTLTIPTELDDVAVLVETGGDDVVFG